MYKSVLYDSKINKGIWLSTELKCCNCGKEHYIIIEIRAKQKFDALECPYCLTYGCNFHYALVQKLFILPILKRRK